MYTVAYSNQAIKFLKSSEKIILQRLMNKIEELQMDPFGHDTKSVEGYKEKLYRVRVGDYRILYVVEETTKTLEIIKIDKRSRVY